MVGIGSGDLVAATLAGRLPLKAVPMLLGQKETEQSTLALDLGEPEQSTDQPLLWWSAAAKGWVGADRRQLAIDVPADSDSRAAPAADDPDRRRAIRPKPRLPASSSPGDDPTGVDSLLKPLLERIDWSERAPFAAGAPRGAPRPGSG